MKRVIFVLLFLQISVFYAVGVHAGDAFCQLLDIRA